MSGKSIKKARSSTADKNNSRFKPNSSILKNCFSNNTNNVT